MPLVDNVLQLEGGDDYRKPGQDDAIRIRFGRIKTGFTVRQIANDPALLPTLRDEDWEDLLITHNGSVEARRTLSDAILAVTRMMTLGERVLIVEDERKQILDKGRRIYMVKLVGIQPQDFTDLWFLFKSSLKDLQVAIRGMPSKLSWEVLKTVGDSPQLQQLQIRLEIFKRVIDNPPETRVFPYWPEYSRDVKGVLAKVEQYVKILRDWAKNSRTPAAHHLLRGLERDMVFCKAEFENLHPSSWKEKGLRKQREFYKEVPLSNILCHECSSYLSKLIDDEGDEEEEE